MNETLATGGPELDALLSEHEVIPRLIEKSVTAKG